MKRLLPGLATTCRSPPVWLRLLVQPQGSLQPLLSIPCPPPALPHFPPCWARTRSRDQGRICFYSAVKGEGIKSGPHGLGLLWEVPDAWAVGRRWLCWVSKGTDPIGSLPGTAVCGHMATGPTHSLFQGCEPLCSTRPIRRSHFPKGGAIVQGGGKPPHSYLLLQLPLVPQSGVGVGGEGASCVSYPPGVEFPLAPSSKEKSRKRPPPQKCLIGVPSNEDRGCEGKGPGCGRGGTWAWGLEPTQPGQWLRLRPGLSEAQAQCELGDSDLGREGSPALREDGGAHLYLSYLRGKGRPAESVASVPW